MSKDNLDRFKNLVLTLSEFAATDNENGYLLGTVANRMRKETSGDRTLRELLEKLDAEKAARPLSVMTA